MDDAWTMWVPKGIVLGRLGLDTQLFTPSTVYFAFPHPDYPLWWSFMTGIGLRFVGTVDLRAADAQTAIFIFAFFVAATRMLWAWVRPWLLWTGMLLLAVSPELINQTQSGGADLPLAIYLALFVLSSAIWIAARQRLALILAFIFAAAAILIKSEGAPQLVLFAATISLIGFRQGWRRVAYLWAAVAAAFVAASPWLIWRQAHGLQSLSDVPLSDALSPTYLLNRTARIGPSAHRLLMHLTNPREWLVVIPLLLGLSVIAAIRRRQIAWLAPCLFVSLGYGFWTYVNWASPDDLNYLLDTSSYRVVDVLVLVAGLFVPLVAEFGLARRYGAGTALPAVPDRIRAQSQGMSRWSPKERDEQRASRSWLPTTRRTLARSGGRVSTPLIVTNLAGLSSGGGLTYLLGLTGEIRRDVRNVRWRLLLSDEQLRLVSEASAPNIDVLVLPPRGPLRRTLWEQFVLPRSSLARAGSVLLCTANFGCGGRGLPCVVVAHNALHFYPFRQPGWHGRRLTLESRLARASVRRAAATVVPSRSMGKLMRARTGVSPTVLPFGPGLVLRDKPIDDEVFRFVHRTSWGPHKRFDVLLEAVRALAQRRYGEFKVLSACDPHSPFAQSWREAQADTRLLSDPIVAAHVTISPYGPSDQHVAFGNAAVVPSDLESFCFPLAEALVVGMPAVAADVDFAHELCGEAVFYAEPGDAASLAAQMERLLDGDRPLGVPREWRERVSWKAHVDGLVELCCHVAAKL